MTERTPPHLLAFPPASGQHQTAAAVEAHASGRLSDDALSEVFEMITSGNLPTIGWWSRHLRPGSWWAEERRRLAEQADPEALAVLRAIHKERP